MADSGNQSTFSSGAGAVFAMAGVAIGLGNIWRFPYMMGQYGGSVFLFTYLIIVFAFGVPGLMAEWALGRHTRRGPWGAFGSAGMPVGRLWSGIILVTITMAASYYAVVIGWVLQETVAFLRAGTAGGTATPFVELTGGVLRQFVYLAVTVVLGCLIIAFGVRRGIERTSKILMPLFFALFLVLVVRVLMLEDARIGLQRFLKPEWANFTGRTALAALGQAIFSLGLGGMFMVRYGSYMSDEDDIPRGAIFTTIADVVAALMAGLIIVPAVLAFGMDLQGGPSLMFVAMPEVFNAMPAGSWFGAAFFFSVFIVAMLSLIAAYEVIGTALEEGLGWSRTRALVVLATAEIALAAPAYFFGGYIGASDLIWGSTMQPFGAGIAVVALAWFVGRSKALGEIRRNSNIPVPDWVFSWVRFVLPVAIFAILIYGWWDWFGTR